MIDDVPLRDAVLRYQISRSREILSSVQAMLASYIYHYPRKVHHRGHDEASEFYLYVFERLERIILKYEDQGYKFTTWFTAVLRNHYLNFLRASDDSAETLPLLEDRISTAVTMPEPDMQTEDEKRRDDILASLKERFPLRESLYFQMHFLELFKEALVIPLAEYFSVPIHAALTMIEHARATYRKRYTRLLALQDTYARLCEKNIKDVKQHTLKKGSLLKRIGAIQLTVPVRHVASVFSTTITIVMKVIIRIRSFLRIRSAREAA